MIRGSATITDKDLGMRELIQRMQEDDAHVDIGIHSDEGEKLVIIAAANEFGATIDHPGGTAYGYATPNDARKGRMKFLKKGEGYMVVGITKPHTITIPARSYIRSTVDENEDKYFDLSSKLLSRIIDGSMNKFKGLSVMGQTIESDIKRKIISLRSPPNAPSTIRAKGSDNPLVNTGLLGGSIRHVVKDEGSE